VKGESNLEVLRKNDLLRLGKEREDSSSTWRRKQESYRENKGSLVSSKGDGGVEWRGDLAKDRIRKSQQQNRRGERYHSSS